jgi:enoyl-CoA hydratase
MEFALTGDPFDAERAAQLGLVNRMTEPGQALPAALELVSRIASNAPLAGRSSRRVMLQTMTGQDDEGWRLSADAMAEAMGSADMKEGVAAFVEKPPAVEWHLTSFGAAIQPLGVKVSSGSSAGR